MLAFLIPSVLLVNGLAAGVLVGTQLGGWPLLVALPPDQYVRAHAFFSSRYDPFMPACLLGTVLGDALLTVGVPDTGSHALFAMAGLFALATISISITRNAPVNRWVRTLDPGALPVDFTSQDPRPRWGAWNRRRTALAVLALLMNCGGLALLM